MKNDIGGPAPGDTSAPLREECFPSFSPSSLKSNPRKSLRFESRKDAQVPHGVGRKGVRTYFFNRPTEKTAEQKPPQQNFDPAGEVLMIKER